MNPPPEWKYKNRFPIHDRMENIIKLTIDATKSELESARKKLRKLQYGS